MICIVADPGIFQSVSIGQNEADVKSKPLPTDP